MKPEEINPYQPPEAPLFDPVAVRDGSNSPVEGEVESLFVVAMQVMIYVVGLLAMVLAFGLICWSLDSLGRTD